MDEKWLPCVGIPTYEISNKGRLRRAAPGPHTRVGLIRKLKPNRFGYHRPTLWVNGEPYNRSVHALVLEAFVGPRPEGYQINHKNGVKTDNRVTNLEYMTL